MRRGLPLTLTCRVVSGAGDEEGGEARRSGARARQTLEMATRNCSRTSSSYEGSREQQETKATFRRADSSSFGLSSSAAWRTEVAATKSASRAARRGRRRGGEQGEIIRHNEGRDRDESELVQGRHRRQRAHPVLLRDC